MSTRQEIEQQIENEIIALTAKPLPELVGSYLMWQEEHKKLEAEDKLFKRPEAPPYLKDLAEAKELAEAIEVFQARQTAMNEKIHNAEWKAEYHKRAIIRVLPFKNTWLQVGSQLVAYWKTHFGGELKLEIKTFEADGTAPPPPRDR